jgi:hypothetical protein
VKLDPQIAGKLAGTMTALACGLVKSLLELSDRTIAHAIELARADAAARVLGSLEDRCAPNPKTSPPRSRASKRAATKRASARSRGSTAPRSRAARSAAAAPISPISPISPVDGDECASTRSAESSSNRQRRTADTSPQRSRTTLSGAGGSVRLASPRADSPVLGVASDAGRTSASPVISNVRSTATSPAVSAFANDDGAVSDGPVVEPPPPSRAGPIALPRSKHPPRAAANVPPPGWTVEDDRREEFLAESEIFRTY